MLYQLSYASLVERETGIGPATNSLEGCDSTTELLPRRNPLYQEGLPTEVANYLDPAGGVTLHSENGLLGMGPYPTEDEIDARLINAGKQTVTALPGASMFDSAQSLAMIRGGHIDLAILGGLEVACNGDLANWTVPGKLITGMGGAMDLAAGARRVVVLQSHASKDGKPKLVNRLTLPPTALGCTDR